MSGTAEIDGSPNEAAKGLPDKMCESSQDLYQQGARTAPPLVNELQIAQRLLSVVRFTGQLVQYRKGPMGEADVIRVSDKVIETIPAVLEAAKWAAAYWVLEGGDRLSVLSSLSHQLAFGTQERVESHPLIQTCITSRRIVQSEDGTKCCVPVLVEGKTKAVLYIVKQAAAQAQAQPRTRDEPGADDPAMDAAGYRASFPTLEVLASELAVILRELAKTGVHNPAFSLAGAPSTPKAMSAHQNLIAAHGLNKWSFDVNAFSDEELVNLAVAMYDDLGLCSAFGIRVETLTFFVRTVAATYRKEVPFHNWHHAMAVTQVAYYILNNTSVGQGLDDLHRLALLTGALCHDIDHPGLNNHFQVSSQSPLALRYNDVSVLENHHTATAWAILRDERANILSTLSKEDLKIVRSVMISSILSTDMSRHFELLQQFSAKTQGSENWVPTTAEEKKLLANVILHCADLSNPTRPWDMCFHWAKVLSTEFNNQVALERENGLTATAWMETRDSAELAQGELNFIKFIINPWWTGVCASISCLKFTLDYISENVAKYNGFLERAGSGIEEKAQPK